MKQRLLLRIEGFKTGVLGNDSEDMSSEVIPVLCQHHCSHDDPDNTVLAESLALVL